MCTSRPVKLPHWPICRPLSPSFLFLSGDERVLAAAMSKVFCGSTGRATNSLLAQANQAVSIHPLLLTLSTSMLAGSSMCFSAHSWVADSMVMCSTPCTDVASMRAAVLTTSPKAQTTGYACGPELIQLRATGPVATPNLSFANSRLSNAWFTSRAKPTTRVICVSGVSSGVILVPAMQIKQFERVSTRRTLWLSNESSIAVCNDPNHS
mmetsp:Transcript_51749/g.122463  ORF Transcript_51749/g.122463 Transcript_51749/m.122463 type:complete len:209 (-) Transcript_51749:959-1585(-)